MDDTLHAFEAVIGSCVKNGRHVEAGGEPEGGGCQMALLGSSANLPRRSGEPATYHAASGGRIGDAVTEEDL